VFAAMRDKDVTGMFAALLPAVGHLVVTRASNARSAAPDALAERARAIAPGLPVSIEPHLAEALAAAWRLSPRIVVAGSIFLLGDVMKLVDGT
jgi:dihydrofolate synthase/folylpolyglutamate synthase